MLRFVRPAPATRWPAVLSRDEVRRVLALVRIPVYRECLTTGADAAPAFTGRRRSSADALSSVSNGHLDPRGRPRSATHACALTVPRPTLSLAPSVRARAAQLRRRLPRRRVARVPGACRSSVVFIRGTPPIFAPTSRPPHGSRRASSRHAHAR